MTRAVVPDHAAVIGMERGAAMAGEGRRAKTGWAGVAAIAALALAGCGDGGVAGPEDARAADPASPGKTVARAGARSEEQTSERQSIMRNSYAVFRVKKQITK